MGTMRFTKEEKLLMMLYSPGDRPGLCRILQKMQEELEPDERELRVLTDRVLRKLEKMSDEEFDRMDLYPDI